MSKESAIAFIEKTSTDNDLQSCIAALSPNDVSGLMNIAEKAGFTVSVEDLKEIYEGHQADDSISDTDLEQVAGGLNPQPLPPRILSRFRAINPGVMNGIIIVSGFVV
jgi:predicted ribosomally synthesized peptide with nif11-like leader